MSIRFVRNGKWENFGTCLYALVDSGGPWPPKQLIISLHLSPWEARMLHFIHVWNLLTLIDIPSASNILSTTSVFYETFLLLFLFIFTIKAMIKRPKSGNQYDMRHYT
jgi:hypothetical protein